MLRNIAGALFGLTLSLALLADDASARGCRGGGCGGCGGGCEISCGGGGCGGGRHCGRRHHCGGDSCGGGYCGGGVCGLGGFGGGYAYADIYAPVFPYAPAPAYAAADAPATIVVSLPAGAQLIVDGQATASTAGTRVFTTPPLERGYAYTYNFAADVTRDGRTERITQSVVVRAGQETRVSMDLPTGVASR